MSQYRMYYFLRFIRQVDHLLQGTTIGKGTLTNSGNGLRYLYFPQRTAIGKAKLPILVTERGIMNSRKEVQFSNTNTFISVTELGNDTSFKAEQPENAAAPIYTTEPGICTASSNLQFSNAKHSIMLAK